MAPGAEITCASFSTLLTVPTLFVSSSAPAPQVEVSAAKVTRTCRRDGNARIEASVHPSAAAHHRREGRKAVEGPARRVGGVQSASWQPMSPDVIDREVEGRARPKAGVVKLVDTPDLGSGGFGRGGSTPSARTNQLRWMDA